MLVLSRKAGEAISVEGQIKVTIVKINGNRVKVGIEAPDDVHILRSELAEASNQFIDPNSYHESNIRSDLLVQVAK